MFSDCTLRDEIETEFGFEPGLDAGGICISVRDGVTTLTGQVVTLTGEVDWQFQKLLAERTVRRQPGVIGVANLIRVRNQTFVDAIHQRLKEAYRQIADIESNGVKFAMDGAKVTLSGKFEGRSDRCAAENAAWSIPGVSEAVDKQIAA
jgi:osmotically-inducible protein OsmY